MLIRQCIGWDPPKILENLWFRQIFGSTINTFPWRIKSKSKCEAMSSELGQQFRIKNKVAVTLNFELIAAFLFIPYV